MFGIHRCEKRKGGSVNGIHAEAGRTEADRGKFPNSDIDWSKTHENVHVISTDNLLRSAQEKIAESGVKRVRKDAVMILDGFYGASPEFFEGKSKTEIEKYFDECIKFHEKHYGPVLSAIIHYDEATPHLHVQSVPLVEKGDKTVLNASYIMANKKAYSDRQTAFWEEVTQKWGLERGVLREDNNLREHTTKQQWEAKQAEQRLKEALELKDKVVADTDFIMHQRIEASKIKKPLFGADKNVETYHKGSLVQAQTIADNITQNMRDAQFAHTMAIEERREAEQFRDEATKVLKVAKKKQKEIEPLYQKAIEERDKWRSANEHLEELIDKKATEKAADMVSELTQGRDIDKLNFMERFMEQYNINGVSLKDLCIQAWEQFIESIGLDIGHGLHV